MHKEILTQEQKELLSLVRKFSRIFGVVGGTAIALYIGHRESIDFDLFSLKEFDNNTIRKKIVKSNRIEEIIKDEIGQYTLSIKKVRFTFFHYSYKITFSKNFEDYFRMPSLLTLAAMKAHVLGRRGKWKDYVDLYFIIKHHFDIDAIVKKAKRIFVNEFNEKLFRVQLSYFADIDYREKVVFMPGFEVSDEIIKKELTKFSVS